jgi:hypothetical protein
MPPMQSQFQKDLVARVNTQAEAASAAARPGLLALLGEADFQQTLRKCCPQIAHESPEQLMNRLRAEVMAAELTHNFNANRTGSWEGDIDLDQLEQAEYFYNLWTLQYLNLVPVTRQVEEDVAEVYLMGFRPFSNASAVGNSTPATYVDATDRPLYTTSNLLHIDTGAPATNAAAATCQRPT